MKYFVNKECNYNILCWCKNNPVPFGASNFLSDIEYCLCFYEKGAKFYDGVDHKSKFYISNLNQADKKKYKHPTIKPLNLVKRHILNSSKEGDIILDCFSRKWNNLCSSKRVRKTIYRNRNRFKISQNQFRQIKRNISKWTNKFWYRYK